MGKELRDKQTGIWLNYATPVSQVRERIQLILDGEILNTPDSDAELPQGVYGALDLLAAFRLKPPL